MIWLALVYDTSTIVGYLKPNPVFKYIVNMICKHIFQITFLNKSELILLYSVKWFQVFLCNSNNVIVFCLHLFE